MVLVQTLTIISGHSTMRNTVAGLFVSVEFVFGCSNVSSDVIFSLPVVKSMTALMHYVFVPLKLLL